MAQSHRLGFGDTLGTKQTFVHSLLVFIFVRKWW